VLRFIENLVVQWHSQRGGVGAQEARASLKLSIYRIEGERERERVVRMTFYIMLCRSMQ